MLLLEFSSLHELRNIKTNGTQLMVLHIQKLEKYVKLETIISLLEKTMIKKVIYYFKHRTEVFIIIIDVYK
jgi:hypothetical protein